MCLEDAANCPQDQDCSLGQQATVSKITGGKHKSYANTLVTKIINTSTGVDQPGEDRGLAASNSVEFKQGGVRLTSSFTLGASRASPGVISQRPRRRAQSTRLVLSPISSFLTGRELQW